MPSFSLRSMERLGTCDPILMDLFLEVVQHFDCTVLEGHRGQEDQDRAFAQGKSKLKFPRGKHNASPSLAVDVAPYPIDWNDTDRWRTFGGFVLGIAALKCPEVRIRWGGDWDGDWDLKDQGFIDLPHFEIKR